jgi:hypothetical protein
MKYTKLQEHQRAVKPFDRPITAQVGKVVVMAYLSDPDDYGLRFHICTDKFGSKEIIKMTVDDFHMLTPTELRWLADVWEHYERWLQNKEDWPLPECTN